MQTLVAQLLRDLENGKINRRDFIQAVAVAATTLPAASAQPAGGFKTVAVDHISYEVANYKRTRDFYADLMGMTVSDDNGTNQCQLHFGDSMIIARNRPAGVSGARVDHIDYRIRDWNTGTVKAELERRNLKPRLDTGGNTTGLSDFASFHVRDPTDSICRSAESFSPGIPSTKNANREQPMDAAFWRDLFHLDVSILEKIVRPILVYFFLVISLRLAGKRELAQLNPFDLVVLLTLSNTVQNAIIGNDNSVLGGIIGATTLLAVNYFVVRFLYSHKRLDRLVEGDADVLIEEGRIRMDRLKRELITASELEVAAHKQGFTSLDQIERAVLEAGGSISFTGKQPLPEEKRFAEVLQRLDAISAAVADLRARQQG